ncbi:MAG: hypothetical protein GY820_01260 [Gammaproteobacteria bacterium]|nr:hypothetical protein [Gammaproteobacteria bacterium]
MRGPCGPQMRASACSTERRMPNLTPGGSGPRRDVMSANRSSERARSTLARRSTPSTAASLDGRRRFHLTRRRPSHPSQAVADRAHHNCKLKARDLHRVKT